MRHRTASCLIVLLLGCAHQAARTEGEVFLLKTAAADLHVHGPPSPLRFRDVRSGHLATTDAAKPDILCGELQRATPDDKAAWTAFATIRTSSYEQWLGAMATEFCKRAALESGDLSTSLQARLEALE